MVASTVLGSGAGTDHDFLDDASVGIGNDKANKTWTNSIYDLYNQSAFSVCYSVGEGYLVVGQNSLFQKGTKVSVPIVSKEEDPDKIHLSLGIINIGEEKEENEIEVSGGSALLDSTVYKVGMEPVLYT